MPNFPRSDEEIIEELRTGKDARPTTTKEGDYNLTDAGNAEFYAGEYGVRVRYDHRRGLYFVWDDNLWAADCDGALTRFAVEAARKRGIEAYIKEEK